MAAKKRKRKSSTSGRKRTKTEIRAALSRAAKRRPRRADGRFK